MTGTKTNLDTLPNEMLLRIAEYTGAHSCYLGYGAVNKRINQIFNTYAYINKLSKSTSYGGYAPFEKIVQECEMKLRIENNNKHYDQGIPYICRQLACGAISFNREDLLEWSLKKRKKQSSILIRALCERAIQDKRLCIMRRVCDSIEDVYLLAYLKEHTNFVKVAVEEGDLDTLKYLHEELECEWDSCACEYAARKGRLEFLKYLHEHGCEWNANACCGAARNGHLKCLEYLQENGCEWNADACSSAAAGGYLDCLVYFHECGCEWDTSACTLAAANGHLDCLQYMRDIGLEWHAYDKYLGSATSGVSGRLMLPGERLWFVDPQLRNMI
jgi:hypothetical protein